MSEEESLIHRGIQGSLPTSEYSERKREAQEGVYHHISTGVKVEYPNALSNDYYSEKISKYAPGNKKYFIWLAFSKYAKAVREFYCSAVYFFNKTSSQQVELEKYINQGTLCKGATADDDIKMLTTLSKNMLEAEKNLIQTLSRNNTTIDARCNEHKALQQLREMGATAWLVYNNLTSDKEVDDKPLSFYSIVDFKTKNADKDMSKDRNIALISAGHYKVEYFVQTKIKCHFKKRDIRQNVTPFERRNNQSPELYKNVDAHQMYSRFIKMFNGYVFEDNQQTLEQQQKQVTDSTATLVIDFYKNMYADVKHVYKDLFYWGDYYFRSTKQENYTILNDTYGPHDKRDRNLHATAKQYVEFLTTAIQKCTDNKDDYSFFIKDAKFLIARLTKAIEYTTDIYNQTPSQLKKSYEGL